MRWLGLIVLASCTGGSKPGPVLAISHNGKSYCVMYLRDAQGENSPTLTVTEGQCPEITEGSP